MIELLADYAHTSWCGWMTYMFSKCTRNEDGTMTIPAWAVERWERQCYTLYLQLPEDEKQSDRVEAQKMMDIIRAFI